MKVYLFSEKENIAVLPSIGFNEDQIGEVAWAENIIDYLLEQFILNIRFQGRDFDFTSWEEYQDAMQKIKHLQEFQEYVHLLPKKKQEYDFNKVIQEAEDKAEKKRNKERWDDMLE